MSDVEMLAKRIHDLETQNTELIRLASALLKRLETLTTEEFSKGGEKEEREALRNYLKEIAK